MAETPAPTPEDVGRFLHDLRRHRERLQALARDIGADDEFMATIDEVAEHLLVADEELRVQTEQLELSTRRLDLLVAAHEELFANAPTAYVQTDADGLIMRYNRAARDLLGLPATTHRSYAFINLFVDEDRPGLRDYVSRLRSTETGVPFSGAGELLEASVRRPDGRALPVVLTGRRSGEPGYGRPILHWELQVRAETLESVRLTPPRPMRTQTLADAAADLARQDGPGPTLEHVAQQALAAVPACDEVGVMIMRSHGRVSAPISTGPLAAACDELQFAIGDGPCLGSIDEALPIRVADLATEPRWPRFGPQAAALGAASMLALPLATPRGTLGALNLYAKAPDAFDAEDELVGQAFATHAGIAFAHAELEANLRIGLRTREEIGRAVGILMERHRVTASAAFDMLVLASQHSHRKLRDVAVWVNETGEDPSALVRESRRRAAD